LPSLLTEVPGKRVLKTSDVFRSAPFAAFCGVLLTGLALPLKPAPRVASPYKRTLITLHLVTILTSEARVCGCLTDSRCRPTEVLT